MAEVFCEPADGAAGAQEEFRRFGSLGTLFTTGCNIPIFVAGHAEIKPFRKPCADFEWHNYYDEDDILGWPLGPLSPEYAALVNDHPVNVGSLLASWNPMSHLAYWSDRDVLDPIAAHLRSLLL